MNDLKNKPLPLEARELLMRGNQKEAIKYLCQKYTIDRSEADKLISDYKKQLKDRRVELEVQIIHDKERMESKKNKDLIILWTLRLTAVLIIFGLLYTVIITTITK